MEIDIKLAAFLWAVGVALLFNVMKKRHNLQDAVYEGLGIIAMLLTMIAVLLYYIYQKI